MSTLDASIVNIAMPMISKSLKIDMSQAEWIVKIIKLSIIKGVFLYKLLRNILNII